MQAIAHCLAFYQHNLETADAYDSPHTRLREAIRDYQQLLEIDQQLDLEDYIQQNADDTHEPNRSTAFHRPAARTIRAAVRSSLPDR